MKKLTSSMIVLGILALVVSSAGAATTLNCDAKTRCDAYLKNCVEDSYTFTATVDPQRQVVVVGSNQVKADFSNAAEVSFIFTKYLVRLNRYEYSAILTTDGEVRYGQCKKVDPAW